MEPLAFLVALHLASAPVEAPLSLSADQAYELRTGKVRTVGLRVPGAGSVKAQADRPHFSGAKLIGLVRGEAQRRLHGRRGQVQCDEKGEWFHRDDLAVSIMETHRARMRP